MACFMAPWWPGANMKPTPTSRTQRATCAGVRSSRTPAASRTSALPDLLETERLPCLATWQPAAAATNMLAVETLKVPRHHRRCRRCPRYVAARRCPPRWPGPASPRRRRRSPRPSRPSCAGPPGSRRSAPGRPAGHDERMTARHLGVRQVMALHDLGDRLLDIHGCHPPKVVYEWSPRAHGAERPSPRGSGRGRAGRAAVTDLPENCAAAHGRARVRMDSGWNCTPCTGSSAMAHAHDLVALARRGTGPGGHLQAIRQAGGLDHQRMIAGRLEGLVEPAERPPCRRDGWARSCRA